MLVLFEWVKILTEGGNEKFERVKPFFASLKYAYVYVCARPLDY